MAWALLLLAPVLYVLALIAMNWTTVRENCTMIYRCYLNLQDVPGPHSLPLIGAAYQFKLNSVEFTSQLLDWMELYCNVVPNRMGLVKAWVGPIPIVVVVGPEYCKALLESNTLITKATQYDIVTSWIGTGLLTSTNEKWFGRRKMLTPAFHFNVLKSYKEVFARYGEVFVDHIEQFADTGREFDLFPQIKRCAMDIICETAMGTQLNSMTGGNSEYVDAVVRISDIIWSHQRFPWLWLKPIWYGSGIGREFDRLVKMTNDFTRNVIAERRQALEDEGLLEDLQTGTMTDEEVKKRKLVFLDLLLMKQKAAALTDEDIREEVDTFMFEGHDTTASGMAFCAWFLGQFPEYQQRVHDEVDEVFGDSDRPPTEADLTRLVYLEKCVKEALRLCPSVPLLARRLTHDLVLDNVTIPENTTAVLAPLATHRDPKQWERPEEFYPEHFSADAIAARHPYAYYPFSAGPRNCIGQKFAIAEEKTVLSWLFRRYRVVSAVPHPGNRPIPEVILKPSDGVQCRLYRRKAVS